MIKQAHTYLVGALSGVTLIGIAIAVFVVLVSAQVFHELPIVNVSSPDHKATSISPAKALPAGGGTTTAAGTGGTTAKVARRHAGHRRGALADSPGAKSGGSHHGTAADRGALAAATGPATAVQGAPTVGGGKTSPSGGDAGSHSSQPAAGSPAQSPPSSGGGGASGTSGSSTPNGASRSSGTGSGSTGSSGATGTGSGTGTTPTGPVTAGVNSAAEELNETVHGADENLLGGTLEKTGVTEVTEGVVNGVAGPETVVGKTVEGVTEAVNGLLGSGSH